MVDFIHEKVSDYMEPSQPLSSSPVGPVSWLAFLHMIDRKLVGINTSNEMFLAFAYSGISQKNI